MASTIHTPSVGLAAPEKPRFLFHHLTTRTTLTPAIHIRKHSNPSLSFNFNRCSSLRLPPLIRACQPRNQAGGNGNEPARSSGLAKEVGWTSSLLNFVGDNFLPLALMGGVVLGLANPSLGCLADRYKLSKFSTFAIFVISGMTLRNGDIGAAAEAWPVGVLGLLSILLFTPCFSRVIVQIPLQPQEFVSGLAIFCCMPTTLSSGVALTQLAGGNSALALAMTVISSLLGILMVPFSISKYVAAGVGVSVPTKELFRSLVQTLLVPLIVGKIFRESFKGLADFVDQNRRLFSRLSAVFLSLVPWIQVSRSRSLLLMVKPAVFLVAVGLGVVLHIVLLAFNAVTINSLSALSGGDQSVFSKKENSTAYLLVASQKTLPVLVAVVEQLGGAFGESGLLVLPCVAAHLVQVLYIATLISLCLSLAMPLSDC
ncbi:Probable sodium/metabolite cotransporter BASS4, chloroplastic [Linum grandiflorum]